MNEWIFHSHGKHSIGLDVKNNIQFFTSLIQPFGTMCHITVVLCFCWCQFHLLSALVTRKGGSILTDHTIPVQPHNGMMGELTVVSESSVKVTLHIHVHDTRTFVPENILHNIQPVDIFHNTKVINFLTPRGKGKCKFKGLLFMKCLLWSEQQTSSLFIWSWNLKYGFRYT